MAATDSQLPICRRELAAMFVVINAGNPHVLVVVPVLITIVVAFARRNNAAGGQNGKAHKKAADYETLCIFHDLS
jgi:hypothetical protein